ncbi:hypothetical protein [Streptomyces sp. NPDC058304]|uniref:hypothetical protein n=1 Tax=Streptomyces sp. NPDC058304 TaxID=3346437 RepID=UPI0036E0FC80
MTPNDSTPPAETAMKKDSPRRDAIRAWWTKAWTEGGAFHEMWDDLGRVHRSDWHEIAPWIKSLLGVAGFSFVVLLARTALGALLGGLHEILTAVPTVQVGDNTSSGVWATIDNPIRAYIAAHCASLPISASTVYTLWQLTGLFGLIAGFATRNNGVRLLWTGWGLASIAMVWATAPATSRPVAAGIAVFAWALASAFALRGLNLRPRVFTTVHTAAPQVTVQPQIHIPAQPDGPAPDNVRQLSR